MSDEKNLTEIHKVILICEKSSLCGEKIPSYKDNFFLVIIIPLIISLLISLIGAFYNMKLDKEKKSHEILSTKAVEAYTYFADQVGNFSSRFQLFVTKKETDVDKINKFKESIDEASINLHFYLDGGDVEIVNRIKQLSFLLLDTAREHNLIEAVGTGSDLSRNRTNYKMYLYESLKECNICLLRLSFLQTYSMPSKINQSYCKENFGKVVKVFTAKIDEYKKIETSKQTVDIKNFLRFIEMLRSKDSLDYEITTCSDLRV